MKFTRKTLVILVLVIHVLGLIVNPLIFKHSDIKYFIQIISLCTSGLLCAVYAVFEYKYKIRQSMRVRLLETFVAIIYGLLLVLLLKYL
jgi:hypothetical protein